jgi:hypothetical protein
VNNVAGQSQACATGITKAMALANRALMDCYCATAPTTSVLSDGDCSAWLRAQSTSLGIQNAASVTVLIINNILVEALKRLSAFEAHTSIDELQLSLSQRLFAMQFINTGILPVLVNAQLPGLPSHAGAQYRDFTSEWYFNVGSAMLLTMVRGGGGGEGGRLCVTLAVRWWSAAFAVRANDRLIAPSAS